MTFTSDFQWQRRFIPEMKRICGELLITEAPASEDNEHNTDLIVLKLEAVRIACRVRKCEYLQRYGDEFTLRETRPSGVQTELQKVISGWGDYILYGFASPEQDCLARWFVGDLKVFRLWHQGTSLRLRSTPGKRQPNRDGSSTFRAYRLSAMPSSFVIRQSLRKTAA